MSGIDLSGLGNYMDSMVQTDTQTSRLTDKLDRADATTASELKEACKEFESYFIEQVYKEMLKTVETEDSGSSVSKLVDYFKDNTIQTIAAQTTEQTGGAFAKQMYEQMRRNYNIKEAYDEV